jgi:hypothetical protein
METTKITLSIALFLTSLTIFVIFLAQILVH